MSRWRVIGNFFKQKNFLYKHMYVCAYVCMFATAGVIVCVSTFSCQLIRQGFSKQPIKNQNNLVHN